MATSLPTDIDSTYPDASPGDATHQQHHDQIHQYTNDHDTAVDPHGDRAYADGKFIAGADAQTQSINIFESTTSTTPVDLTTVGPVVTVDIGASGRALVMLSTYMENNTASAGGQMGFAISGATTRAVQESRSLWATSAVAGEKSAAGVTFLVSTLTPGSNTFTAKYKATAGTASFTYRNLTVIPL